MKKIFVFIGISLLFISISRGQNRPLVVDNRQYYPPPRTQLTQGNCTHFALIYYLKSAIWNKKFGRNPQLEENQFSHTFVWNQNIIPFAGVSSINYAAYFMQNQGCATAADFPIDDTNATNMPGPEAREKALAYKTKQRIGRYYAPGGYENTTAVTQEFINSLKDELIKGNGFTIQFDIYPSFSDLEGDNIVYNCYNKPSRDSVEFMHEVAIIGYDDTIKTALGRGAFIAINSHQKLPYFYFDYNWFLVGELATTATFLEEDFSSNPEAALHISIENSLINSPFYKREHLFIDAVFKKDNWMVDFDQVNDFLYRKNIAQIVSVNGRKIPLRGNHLLLPINSEDGSYKVVGDITELLNGEEFETIEIVVFDPISGEYVGAGGSVIHSFARESQMEVSNSYLNLLGEDTKFVGKIKDLPDTTFVFNNIRSFQLINFVPYNQLTDEDMKYGAFVKLSTSVVKRKLITISREDITVNTSPQFVNKLETEIISQDSLFSYQFEGVDAENDALTYRLSGVYLPRFTVDSVFFHYDTVSNSGANIDSQTGLFTYQGVIPDDWYGDYYLLDFVVELSDKAYTVKDTFSIKVLRRPNEPPVFESDGNTLYYCEKDSTFFFDFIVSDPEGEQVSVTIVDDLAGRAGLTQDNVNLSMYSLYFFADEVGGFRITLQYSDGHHTLTKDVNIEVTAPIVNEPPVFESDGNTLYYCEKDSTFFFDFIVSDPEGEQVSVTIVDDLAGRAGLTQDNVNLSQYSLYFFADEVGGFRITLQYSDGHHTLTKDVNIEVTAPIVNEPPVFESDGKTLYYCEKDSTFFFNFIVTDPEGEQVSVTIADDLAGRAGLTQDNVNLSQYSLYFFADEVGGFRITLQYSDGHHTLTKDVNIEVTAPIVNEPPVFESDGNTLYYCEKDSTFFFDFIVSDPEREQVSVTIVDDLAGRAGLTQDNVNLSQYSLYFFADEVGGFRITLQYSDGHHTLTKDVNIEVTPATGINDRYMPNFELVAYPNPVHDNLNFDFNLPQRGMINLEIYNMTGQLIETAISDHFESGNNHTTFNCSNLKPGTYFCRLKDESNTVQTIKIVKR